MTKVTVVIDNKTTTIGKAVKDGVKYDVRETNTLWKIKSRDVSPQLEIQFEKKDIPNVQALKETLAQMGYTMQE